MSDPCKTVVIIPPLTICLGVSRFDLAEGAAVSCLATQPIRTSVVAVPGDDTLLFQNCIWNGRGINFFSDEPRPMRVIMDGVRNNGGNLVIQVSGTLLAMNPTPVSTVVLNNSFWMSAADVGLVQNAAESTVTATNSILFFTSSSGAFFNSSVTVENCNLNVNNGIIAYRYLVAMQLSAGTNITGMSFTIRSSTLAGNGFFLYFIPGTPQGLDALTITIDRSDIQSIAYGNWGGLTLLISGNPGPNKHVYITVTNSYIAGISYADNGITLGIVAQSSFVSDVAVVVVNSTIYAYVSRSSPVSLALHVQEMAVSNVGFWLRNSTISSVANGGYLTAAGLVTFEAYTATLQASNITLHAKNCTMLSQNTGTGAAVSLGVRVYQGFKQLNISMTSLVAISSTIKSVAAPGCGSEISAPEGEVLAISPVHCTDNISVGLLSSLIEGKSCVAECNSTAGSSIRYSRFNCQTVGKDIVGGCLAPSNLFLTNTTFNSSAQSDAFVGGTDDPSGNTGPFQISATGCPVVGQFPAWFADYFDGSRPSVETPCHIAGAASTCLRRAGCTWDRTRGACVPKICGGLNSSACADDPWCVISTPTSCERASCSTLSSGTSCTTDRGCFVNGTGGCQPFGCNGTDPLRCPLECQWYPSKGRCSHTLTLTDSSSATLSRTVSISKAVSRTPTRPKPVNRTPRPSVVNSTSAPTPNTTTPANLTLRPMTSTSVPAQGTPAPPVRTRTHRHHMETRTRSLPNDRLLSRNFEPAPHVSRALATVVDPSVASVLISSDSLATVMGGVFHPVAAMQAGRQMALTGVVYCLFTESDTEPSLAEHPVQLRFGIGSSDWALYVGFNLASFLIFIVIPTTTLAVVLLVGRLRPANHHQLALFQERIASTLFFITLAYFGPEMWKTAILVGLHSADDADRALAVLPLILTGILSVIVFWCIGPKFYSLITVVHQTSDSTSKEAEEEGTAHFQFRNLQPNSLAMETLKPSFDACRTSTMPARGYFIAEFLVTCALQALDGVRPLSGSCSPFAISMLVLALGHLIFLCTVRPYREPAEMWTSVAGSALSALLGTLAVVMTFLQSRTVEEAFGSVVLATSIFFFVQAFILAFVALGASHKKRLAKMWGLAGDAGTSISRTNCSTIPTVECNSTLEVPMFKKR